MSNRITWVVSLAALALGGGLKAASEFDVENIPRQEIRGWGLTPTPLDWDGRIIPRAEARAHVQAIYRDSGITMIRLLLGASNLYSNELRQARPLGVDWALEDQLKLAQEAGIREYMITVLSAPVYLKTHYAAAPQVLGEPNTLRADCEDLFANYVGDILNRVREKGLTFPKAISIQMQPDNPPADWGMPVTAAHGTAYSAAQWWRVLRKVRVELDRRGHQRVDLIGPETFGPLGWKGWASHEEFRATAEPQPDSTLAGWAYHSDGLPPEYFRSSSGPRATMVDHMRQRNAVWMLSSNSNNAHDDEQVLVQTFQSLRRELIETGASYWFWRYAFDWRASSEVLASGRSGVRAPVYHALTKLWKASPPGAHVHRLVPSPESGASDLEGFALVTEDRIVRVCINPTGQADTAVFCRLSGEVETSVYGPGAQTSVSVNVSPGQKLPVAIPPGGLAIVVAKVPPIVTSNHVP